MYMGLSPYQHQAVLKSPSPVNSLLPSSVPHVLIGGDEDIPRVDVGDRQNTLTLASNPLLPEKVSIEEGVGPQLPNDGCSFRSRFVCKLLLLWHNLIDFVARKLGIGKKDRSSNPGKRSSDPSRDHNLTDHDHDQLRRIPQFVFEYAPLVHLHSEEKYWPCDMAEHLKHVQPFDDYMPIHSPGEVHCNLTNLDRVNEYGSSMYLTSDDDVDKRPAWLRGDDNVPSAATSNTTTFSRSKAPAVLLVVPKRDGVVDAFWFFFYSFNLGNKVLGMRFGNHVGDWEYTLIRFQHEEPKLVWLSQHAGGEAYTYAALEKSGKRPVVYSAVGSHAMYATPAVQKYILPFGLLADKTEKGPLWDPALNLYSFAYNASEDWVLSSNMTPKAPTEWFYFNGKWGDKAYRLWDHGQYWFFGQWHYGDGPGGPHTKRLRKQKFCKDCKVKDRLPNFT